MNADDLHALGLFAELQRLSAADTASNPDQAPTARVTIRTATGEYIGEVTLGPRAATESTNAHSVIADWATAKPANYQAGRTPAPAPAELDPLLIAAIEDHFADVDPQSYLDDVFGSQDTEAAAAAYEELVTGEWDGNL